ncbi:MAG: hypothetical protein WCC12_03315 [Anaerolineales bacterium]
MSKKRPVKNAKAAPGPGRNVLLALTLVPPIIGLLLIAAWVLDIPIFDDPQSQVTVAVLFLLLGFALSNVVQKRWRLAAGWGLLMLADLVILVWLEVWAQAAAIGLGLLGLFFLGIEFYGQYHQNKDRQK